MSSNRTKSSKKPTYVARANAHHITLYDPYGNELAKDVVNEFERIASELALKNGLIIGIAST